MPRGRSIRPILTLEEIRRKDPWDPAGWREWTDLPGALQCAVARTWLLAKPVLAEERLRLHFALARAGINEFEAVRHEEPRWMVTHLRGLLPERIPEGERLPGWVRKGLAFFFNCSERAIQKRCTEDRDRWRKVAEWTHEGLADEPWAEKLIERLPDPPDIKHWQVFAAGDWRLASALGYAVHCEGRYVSRHFNREEGRAGLHRVYRLARQLPNSSMARFIGLDCPSASDGNPDEALPFNSPESLPWGEYDAAFEGKPMICPYPFHGFVE